MVPAKDPEPVVEKIEFILSLEHLNNIKDYKNGNKIIMFSVIGAWSLIIIWCVCNCINFKTSCCCKRKKIEDRNPYSQGNRNK